MKRKITYILVFCITFSMSFNITAAAPSSVDIFNEVLFYIQNLHVEEFELDELMQGAIKGMVNSLDSHSEYLSADEYEDMKTEFEGHFGGIGIIITADMTIVSPIKGTPGDEVGLQASDQIIAINGESTEDMTQDYAVSLMRGKPGTEVNITIKREDEHMPLEFDIVRADIEVPNVEAEMINDNIAYIQVIQFVQGVGNKVREEISRLEESGAESIILDLRSNPGGLMHEAVNLSSNFLDKGEVVSAKGRRGITDVFEINTRIESTDLPLVVLINQGSASASEIVAGALRDYDRAVIMGMKSFGKGTVQNVFDLPDGTAVKLTTQKYYTPSGDYIHDKGIDPDIVIEYDPEYEGEYDNQLKEAVEYLEEYNNIKVEKAS